MTQRLAADPPSFRDGRTLIVAGLIAIASGFAVASGLAGVLIVSITLAAITWRWPAIVPALLLAGPGFLHLLTSISSSSTEPAVRGDILASPLLFFPILGALLGPPIVKALLTTGAPFRAAVFARRSAGRWFAVGMLFLWGLLAVRYVGTPSPTYGATKVVGFLAYSVVPAMLVLLTARDRRDAELTLNALTFVGGAWLGLSLLIAISQGSLNLYYADPGELLGGTNQSAGGLGIRAAAVALAALASVAYTKRFRFAKLSIAVLAIATAILSAHRGSLMAFAVGMVGLAIAMWRSGSEARMHVRLGFLAVVIFLAAWWGWVSAPPEVQERLLNPLSTSYYDRLALQGIALSAWAESPIIGNGTGSSAYFIAGGDQPEFGVVRGIYPHNVTIELLAEVGLIGASVFLVTMIGLLIKAYRAIPDLGTDWAVPALFAMLLMTFVVAQSDADLTIHNDLWILSALLAVGLSPAERVSEGEAPRDRAVAQASLRA